MTDLNTKEDKKTPGQTGLTIGVIAAFTTLGAYLTAFMYEKGFTSYFRIPAQFITLDWTTVLIAAVAVLIILGITMMLMDMLSPIFSPTKGPFGLALSRVVMRSVLFALPLAFLARGWLWVMVPAIPLGWVLIEFGIPYVSHRREGTYEERLERYQREIASRRPDRGLSERIPRSLFWLLLIVVWICWLAYSMGISSARGQKDFLVVNTTPEAVVLRPYHDHLVCAYFDRETGEIDESYFVLKTASDSGTILTREEVGPLHLKKD